MIKEILFGGCLCGSIRFEVTGRPSTIANCHCTMCRRASGGAFLPYAAYDTAQLRFTRMEPARYRSSNEAFRGFCPKCGSSIFFAYAAEPERIWMTLGCFDDASAHEPGENWYTGDKLAWIHLDDRLTNWVGAPDWVAERTARPKE